MGAEILIVDDNPANLKLARVLLVGEGYDVRTANDAEQAIRTIEAWAPRLILMDIQLPGMDGLELTRLLKNDPKTHDISIVALTAYAMKGDEERARSAGCDGYIAKPIDPDTFPATVATYLASVRPAPSPTAAPSVGGVLVIEDNPATRRFYRAVLEGEGYVVREAATAEEALACVRAALPLVILQDLVLPDMDGLELTQRLREVPGGAEVPIVAVSGVHRALDDARSLPVGFDAFLVKPVDPERLAATVRSYSPTRGRDGALGRGRHVLVVDDDPVQLKLVRLHLTHLGFRTSAAADATTALELARRDPPEIVLSDVLMPGLDGFDLCMAIRRDSRLEKTPVILVSAHLRDGADAELARRVGADGLVRRTPDLAEVVNALHARLGQTTATPNALDGSVEHDVAIGREARERRMIQQLERQVTINAGLAQRCALQAAQLSILGGVADALARSGNLETVLAEVLHACLDAGGISKGAVFETDTNGSLVLRHAIGFSETERPKLATAFGQPGILAKVASSGVSLVIPGPTLDDRHARTFLDEAGVTSALVVPLVGAGRSMGALVLGSNVSDLGQQDLTGFGRAIGAYLGQAAALAAAFGKLNESERRKTQFLNMLGHELRNPLAPILTASQDFLGRDGLAPATIARARDVIGRQAKHLSRMVDDLLDVSRITHGKVHLVRENVDLVALIAEVADDHRPAAERARLELILDLPPERLLVSGDRTRLVQVFGNLLNNAIKFTPEGGRISVVAVPDGHTVSVSVEDDGVGINSDLLTEIFEPFTQADRTLDRSAGGLGLGLSVVRGLVVLHGGSVRADSAGAGAGARLTVVLPLHSREPVTPPEKPERPPEPRVPGGGARVLLVEDNLDSATVLKDLLELCGHEVKTFPEGPAALEEARTWRPDLVLCDLGLPGMDGFRVAEELRRDPRTARAKLIAISGYGQDDDRLRSRAAGFDGHLTKPVNASELEQLIDSVAAERLRPR